MPLLPKKQTLRWRCACRTFAGEQPGDPHLWEGRKQDWERGEAELRCWPDRGPSHCLPELCGSRGPLDKSSRVGLREQPTPHIDQRDWNTDSGFSRSVPGPRHVKEGAESSRTEKAMWSRTSDKSGVTGMDGWPSLPKKSWAAHA